ncbi:alpha/beta hydrolase [Methylocapsa acidiphila]|uniref:alpha/beta hydrolase n=1 Tax=Methylocapsa acidiphila TaxID=133552 RepID=UPI000684581D|nr:alpha/beta hydrolase [Methylocapsa acidiphila]
MGRIVSNIGSPRKHHSAPSGSVSSTGRNRVFGAVALIASAASLGGCGNNLKGFLLPVAEGAPGTSQVEMVVATTRLKADSPGEMFSGYRSREPSFADIIVSIPPPGAHQVGQVEWPKQLPGNPATDFVTLKADITDKKAAIAEFSRLLQKAPKKQALVFVHGFNNRFDDAVFRFAQIVHDTGSGDEFVPVLFTWPSKGSVLAYGYDRESSSYSRDALENLLRWLASNPKVDQVTVLAHSMGNWVTLEALRQMAIRDGRVAAKIRTVLLAAPDVDVDLAREQIATMGPERPNFILFLSENDRALAVSRELWGGPRLGAIDPYVEPFKTDLAREKIQVVNLTNFQSTDKFDHGTYAGNPKAVAILGQSLESGQTLTDSRVGLGERIMTTTAGAASSIGHAASLVVTAPVAVVDPMTREHFSDEVDAFTHSVNSAAAPQ